jgi:hypothetical protein
MPQTDKTEGAVAKLGVLQQPPKSFSSFEQSCEGQEKEE